MKNKKDFKELDLKIIEIIKELEKYYEDVDLYNTGRSEAFIRKKGDNLDDFLTQLDKSINSLYETSTKIDFVINDF